ncbi:hypothetical protein [Flagellimonas pacifica]|uniref:Sugar transporter n=1 Tax=Flagellimonas pacifica TaxID=1247520 RepID=A0A285N2N9_9FLAO|nr:hypothetical protein [Allomuricauda parva]SNZ02001.1 hypothetical protein SAMN06265377_3858 [Allomuricauda parva]
MTADSTNKPPVWFWVVSVLALLWNLSGVFNYLSQAYTSVEQLEQMTQAQRELFEAQPAWVTAAFAIAVFGGTLGCIALLLRKKWAKPAFLVSLIAIIAQFSYSIFMSSAVEVYGNIAIILSVVTVIIAILLLLLAKKGIQKGWLA